MVYLIKIWQNNGIRSDYFFSLLLLLLDALNTDISYSYMYMSLPLWTSYKDWQMCHWMIKLQTNSDLIMIFHNFAATEASKFGQLNRSVQKKEKTPSGVWICGSYGAKWTRQAPPRVRMIERERREREGGESEENEEREKEETKYFTLHVFWLDEALLSIFQKQNGNWNFIFDENVFERKDKDFTIINIEHDLALLKM